MITNLPSDLEKKIDNIYISLPFSTLTASNLLKGIQPTDSELVTHGKALKVKIHPSNSDLNFRQMVSPAGISWNFSISFQVYENNQVNFQRLNRFMNKKVVVFITTTEYRYQVGWKEQPLSITFREITEGFNVTISGDNYFPASRNKLMSFRATF